MVSCREFVGLFLDDWLAGELPPRRHADCTAHLAACDDCARYLVDYRAMLALLHAEARTNARAPVPEDLVRSILRDVR